MLFPHEEELQMTFCLLRQANGNYVPLNRHFQELGSSNRGSVDYDALKGYPLNLKPGLIKALSSWRSSNPKEIYLYCADHEPWTDYASRMAYYVRLGLLEYLLEEAAPPNTPRDSLPYLV